MSASLKRRNRWLLLAFLATFIVPIGVGQLAYDGGWFRGGQTNQGELINPPLARETLAWQLQRPVRLAPAANASAPADRALAPALAERWWVVYQLPEQCTLACEQSLLALPRMHEGIGRERQRLGVLLVLPAGQDTPPSWLSPALANASYVQWVSAPAEASTTRLANDTWYVMDPMGWIMLRYAIPSEEAAAILRAQEVLDDLVKLLKVSRIG